jgi:hypothetical protein
LFGVKVVDSLKSIHIGWGLPVALVVPSPLHEIWLLPLEKPGTVHPFDFVLLISFDYYQWTRFSLLIQEGIVSGFF